MLIRLLLVLSIVACSSRPQAPQSFIFDLEHVLTSGEVQQLDSLFRAHEQRTGNQIALVTSPTFDGRTPMDFAVTFGDSLGVGDKDRDNGVIIAFSKDRREVFIATGYGTERVLHDSICQRIVDQAMIPRFKSDDAFAGLWAGSMAIVEFLDKPENEIR